MAFIVGSLFMILAIIVYWDDVRGFNLYPLQDPKHEWSPPDSYPETLPIGPSLTPPSTTTAATTSSSTPTTTTTTTTISNTTPTRKEEEKGRETQEEKKLETREDEKKEMNSASVYDKEQEARKQRVMDVCSGKDSMEFPGRTRPFEQIPNRELDHLIVDDKHQIIYCYVPKV